MRLPDGTEFSSGTGFSDREREQPPALGSTVMFRYQELSDGGVPRFPSFVRLSDDLPRVGIPPATVYPALAPAPPPAAPAAAQPLAVRGAAPRYFEYTDERSSKFWQVSLAGALLTTRWGRIGTAGQSKTKEFADAADAAKAFDKLVTEKTSEGYAEKPAPG